MGKFSSSYISLKEEGYANSNALVFVFVFKRKRRERTAMVEYILSTTTLVLHNGKTPEVKGKNFQLLVYR